MLSKPITERLQWFERLAEQHIVTQSIEYPGLYEKNITWDILRTDLIHPVCSGNKFFKLKYYLLEALENKQDRIITYGGAWSNHIAAAAYAARHCGLASTGRIRGEMPAQWSETLLQAKQEGMDLEFLPREDYLRHSSGSLSNPGEYLIPQGGYGMLGAKGAAEMLNFTDKGRYTHICCACGTGTMLAGLISSYGGQDLKSPEQPVTLPHFVGIAVVKDPRLRQNVENLVQPLQIPFTLLFDYHFGGYAKKTDTLVHFMNSFFLQHHVPTDFVYTGKLMFGLRELFNSGFFPEGSRILAIHSGGLQGNKSLKKGTLQY